MSKLVKKDGSSILNLDNYIFSVVNLTYESSDTLNYVVTFEKEVERVIFSIVGNSSTPRDQVQRIYAQIGWNDDNKNVCFIAKGGGFVNGHILPINYLVKLKDN